MEGILTILVIIVASACDPLVILFYGVAAYFGKTWITAAAYGLLAGIGFVMLSLAIFGQPPKPTYLLFRLIACVLGAVVIRLVINGVSKGKDATP